MKKCLHDRFLKIIYGGLFSFIVSSVAQAQPVITSFSPASGPISTTVTISGTGFNSTLANNLVLFGSVRATIQAVTGTTTLAVSVPYGADYRYMSVTNLATGLACYSSIPFGVTYIPLGDNTFRAPLGLTSSSNAKTNFVVFADMNRDGKPDLVVANSDNTVSIFPNQITSTTAIASFGPAVTLGTSGGAVSSSIAIADMNGDGWMDIAAVYSGTNSVSVYGNTTGTPGNTPSFASVRTFATATSPVALSIGDLDKDGKFDLVVVSSLASSNISVLRNTSTGGAISFTSPQIFSAGLSPTSVVIGDIDHDGRPDMLISNGGANTISAFRNTTTISGTITFGAPIVMATGTNPSQIAIGDFDGDTLLDLAIANSGSDNVSVLLNTSTVGTIGFAAHMDFSTGTGSSPSSLAVGDMDGDGTLDIATANLGNSSVSILQNASTVGLLSFNTNADVSNASITSPSRIGVEDVNADGKPDFVVATGGTTNNVAVFLQRIAQVLTIISTSNTLVVDGMLPTAVTTTATDGGGTLSYSMQNGTGAALVNASSGLITAFSAGTVTLTITSSGNSNYASAILNQLITIGQATPTLTITSPNTLTVDATLTAAANTSATFGRGGPFSFTIGGGSGSATVDPNSGLITAIGAGTVTLIVNSSGDGDYFPATTNQVLIIGQATPTLTIVSPITMPVGASITATVNTSATLGRGGAFSFAISGGSGSATVNPNTGLLTAIGLGTVILTVTSAGDTNYNVGSASQSITIGKGTPTLALTSANTILVDGTLTATVSTTAISGGGNFIFMVVAGSGSATVNPNTGLVKGVSVGTVTLTVTSSGDTSYNMATVSQLITIGKTTPTLTLISANALLVYSSLTATVSTTATGGRGGVIAFAIVAGSGSATVNPSTGLVTGIGAGTITLIASSAGDTNYMPASTSQLITVGQAVPILAFTSNNTMLVDGTLTATVTSTANVTVSYSVVNIGVGAAIVNPNTGLIRAMEAGVIRLIATSIATSNYTSASISQVITINKGTPTLTITSAGQIDTGGTLTATVITSATYNRGGIITFAIAAGSGSATVNSSTGLMTGISSGTVTLTATSAGDADYNPISMSQLITIGKSTPTLSVISTNVMSVGSSLTATVLTTAINGQGGAITFAIGGGSGSVTVNPITGLMKALSAGMITLTVSSSGDTRYYAASTSQLITIGKATPTLNMSVANTIVIDSSLTATVTTSATNGRGGAITFAIVAGSGSATVNPNTGLIMGVGAGTVTLIANSIGDSDYNASSTSQLITISKRTPTLTITSSNVISSINGVLTATVTSSATSGGGAITYAILVGSGSATVNSSTGFIQAMGAGVVTLVASSAGDTNYNAATTSQLITIGKNAQVLTITSPNTMLVDGSLLASVTSTVGNGGIITYSIRNGTGSALVNAVTGLIQATIHGTITLIASTAGNSMYASATTSQLIMISKATQTLTITSVNNMLVGQSLTATANTTATYGRGGVKSYSILVGSGSATVNSSTGLIHAVGSGTVTLMVSSAGDADYNPASSSQLLTINGGGLLVIDPTKDGPGVGSVSPSTGSVSLTPISPSKDQAQDDEITISKAVSPNGDGLDDKFIIEHIENYPENEVVITDRRGQVVFKTHGYNNETNAFTGQSNNNIPVIDGVYYYWIVFYDHGLANRFVGYFELKR